MYNSVNYLYLVIVPLLIGLYAQYKVQVAYRENSKVLIRNGWTGSQVARWILDQNGLQHVQVARVRGNLTDHYDPRSNLIRLSDGVYGVNSLAAAGIAAHECGHAIQYARGYLPVRIRAAIIPVTTIGSRIAVPMVLAGLLLSWYPLALLGLTGYLLIALFQLVTLPVEIDASRRALAALSGLGLSQAEEKGVRQVLRAAAMTYVAALLTAITQLLRMLELVGHKDRRTR